MAYVREGACLVWITKRSLMGVSVAMTSDRARTRTPERVRTVAGSPSSNSVASARKIRPRLPRTSAASAPR